MAKKKQKKQPQVQTPELFTVYYMNQDKVFEMRMLLDNRLQTGRTGEKTGTTSSEANINAEADAKVPFLTELQGNIEGKIGHEKQTRMVDMRMRHEHIIDRRGIDRNTLVHVNIRSLLHSTIH